METLIQDIREQAEANETEAGETQTWLQFSVSCGYLDRRRGAELHDEYNEIIAMIVNMINHPEKWIIAKR